MPAKAKVIKEMIANQNARRLDAVQTEKIGLYCAFFV